MKTKSINTSRILGNKWVIALLIIVVVISFVITYYWEIIYDTLDEQTNRQLVREHLATIEFSEQKTEEYDPTLRPVLDLLEESSRLTESILRATETVDINIHIKNNGNGDANNLTIELRPLSKDLPGLSFDDSTKVPLVSKNGGEQKVKITVTGEADLPTGKAKIGIYLVESDSEQKIPIEPLILETRRLPSPKLVLGDSGVNEMGESGNGRIDLNEDIVLKFYVRNVGKGEAKEVNVKVKIDGSGVMPLENTDEDKIITRTFPEIKPGKYEEIKCKYFINSKFTGPKLTFTITATEKQGKYGFSELKTREFSVNTKPEMIGKINSPSIDDEAGNSRWIILIGIILIVFCSILFSIWKLLRRGKQTTPRSTTTQSKPRDSDPRQRAAYKAATGRKERLK